MKPIIEIISLTKVFKDFWHRDKVRAVDNLNITVNSGEVFGLLGPNGSGKTTTIKLILGLLFPTSGIVKVFGLSPRDSLAKTHIGFLPEESYFYKYLNANETMDFYGRLFELPSGERKSRGEKLLKMLGLDASRTRPVGEYSKGMARRIGLGQALINDPDLLSLDEPTAGLDPIGRREVKDFILELKERGKTVLLSSHLLADVEDVCDRIAILYGGKLIAEGRVSELLTMKDVTQISASGISEETVKKVLSVIKQEEKETDVELAKPMESLEEFFLETVRSFESPEEKEQGVRSRESELAAGKESVIRKLTTPESTVKSQTTHASRGYPEVQSPEELSSPEDRVESPESEVKSPEEASPPGAEEKREKASDVVKKLTDKQDK